MTYDAVVMGADHNGLAAAVHLAAVAERTFPDCHPCRTLVRASCAKAPAARSGRPYR
jgi:tRNA U34 5-carboxymethylaminomethyl modifying enzyme MnmG/GidA